MLPSIISTFICIMSFSKALGTVSVHFEPFIQGVAAIPLQVANGVGQLLHQENPLPSPDKLCSTFSSRYSLFAAAYLHLVVAQPPCVPRPPTPSPSDQRQSPFCVPAHSTSRVARRSPSVSRCVQSQISQTVLIVYLYNIISSMLCNHYPRFSCTGLWMKIFVCLL